MTAWLQKLEDALYFVVILMALWTAYVATNRFPFRHVGATSATLYSLVVALGVVAAPIALALYSRRARGLARPPHLFHMLFQPCPEDPILREAWKWARLFGWTWLGGLVALLLFSASP